MNIAPPPCLDAGLRRAAIRQGPMHGLDYAEVDTGDAHLVTVYFLGKLGPLGDQLTVNNFNITGGRRITRISVVKAEVCEQPDPQFDDCVTLTLSCIGDSSTYCVCVVEAGPHGPTDNPHPDFDPRYSCVEFAFPSADAATLDCVTPAMCPEPERPAPDIDYLARDFASFRRLMLDRLSFLLPGWSETHEPDLMMALVELMAYEGDRLSYLQDAVATEAYLNTARQRISLRRHARLVDYHISEGCNARAWVFVHTEGGDAGPLSPDDFYFVTAYPGAPQSGTPLMPADLDPVPADSYQVFEPMAEPLPQRWVRRAIRDARSLCSRLLSGTDPVDALLRQRLDPAVMQSLQEWGGNGDPPADLLDTVLGDLERITATQTLHDQPAFAQHTDEDPIRRMLQGPLDASRMIALNRQLLRRAYAAETMQPETVQFYAAHNEITLYAWGERGCCLPRGATSATLLDADLSDQPAVGAADAERTLPLRILQLSPGNFLLFEEVLGPVTGRPADADPQHRHVVRLTGVQESVDPVFNVPVLEVSWSREDALPFPLCLSSVGPPPACAWIEGVSVARGNVVLVDHGRRQLDELLAVEVDEIVQACDDCFPEEELVPRRYRPVLQHPDLTFAQPLDAGTPASSLLTQDPRQALPEVRLQQIPISPPRLDLPDPLARYRNPVPLTAFDPEDLISPQAAAVRLQQSDAAIDPAAKYLKEHLDSDTLQALGQYAPPAPVPGDLVAGILAGFNLILDAPDLYSDDRFPAATLDDATEALLAEMPLPEDLSLALNRWLLESAFPEALAQTEHFVAVWLPRYDLLESGPDDRVFVVEMDDHRQAHLRFGDSTLGRQPEGSTRFRAFYRSGTGTPGNVGAETITVFVSRHTRFEGITLLPRNPLPAQGGTDPESLQEIRMRAPYSIRRDLVRAVISGDYATIAQRDFPTQLQGAASDLVWRGSWYEARVLLDPEGREGASRKLMATVREDLEQYRRMGHQLRVAQAEYVPLAITLAVCVKPDYQRAHVLRALMDVFSSRILPGGALGFFHPDALRFGKGIAVSRIEAAAAAVQGVLWTRVTQLERLGAGDHGELDMGYLALGPAEIARVDSDPSLPDNGAITFVMEGGR